MRSSSSVRAPEAVRQQAPDRGSQGHRDAAPADRDTCPERELGTVGDAQLLDEQRQERVREVEADEGHDLRDRDDLDRALPRKRPPRVFSGGGLSVRCGVRG